ncbi:hypothetical protein BGZ90_000321 [Linnemannia elongata]|nr:hypothetical protein BGZ90_000321 [Linnemannia elongata]
MTLTFGRVGNAVSRQLGNVPIPFLIRHSKFLYQNQLQDLHRLGEQQDLQTLSRPTSRATIGPGTTTASLETNLPPQQTIPGTHQVAESPTTDRAEEREPSFAGRRREGSFSNSTSGSNVNQAQDTSLKAQASPSLSTSISTFPSYGRPASMSSSASTIRPVQPSSPSPSTRNAGSSQQALFESNMYNSGILSNRGQTQPRSTRGSQLIGTTFDRRHNSYTTNLPTSPRDEAAQADRSVHEPAHPFHHATISASSHSSSPAGHGSRLSPSGRTTDAPNPSTFQDYDRSSTVSSVSTPYSQSNSASQIFEETSFFNQLSSNDSLSRGQHQQQLRADQLNRGGEYQSSSLFGQNQGRYGLGFSGNNPTSSLNYHQSEHDNRDDDDDDTDGDHTDRDDDGSSQDESGPLREQIKQLQLEDVLAFLPVGGTSASGMLQRPADDGYQRRTASGDKMPFQLDDELANLGTKSLEEILGHDGGDEDDGDRVKGIRFKDSMAPSRMRGLGREGDSPTKIRISPERSGPNSQKSSAHNSVGSSFSDLSDSSVTQSAMEDAYLSGYNNSKITDIAKSTGGQATPTTGRQVTHSKTTTENTKQPFRLPSTRLSLHQTMNNNNTPFTFHSHFDSLSLQNQLPPSASIFQGSSQYGTGAESGGGGGGSRKRKSSYEDISPLVMKTRSGIGLEEEIVYDRTMTMMMAGQRRLLEEQRQREHQLALQQQQTLHQLQQQQQQQQHHLHLQQQQQQSASPQKGSSADALRRLFMVGKNQSQEQQPQAQPQTQPEAPSFSNCAGEINGCEVNRIPGMRDRYQAMIRPCTFCGRPECQFCAVNCATCEEMSCRACSVPR